VIEMRRLAHCKRVPDVIPRWVGEVTRQYAELVGEERPGLT
jgi:hypothetical protein